MKLPRLSALTLSVVVLATGTLNAPPAQGDLLSGAEPGTLARPGQITPADLGEDALEGLQFADPTENLDLIAPPEADHQGGASVSHPLSVPAGRAGVEPSLSLVYDSTGGNGWVGTGWDLGLGSVEIDTRWGAPLFCPAAGDLCDTAEGRNVESETYVLDGDQLSPTAVTYPFEPRVADKADWTRRVETEWERIIRHGDSPTNYWWEVTDKNGTTRFYGGTPEGERDEQAILSDDGGNAVRWGLSGVRDISSNVMRISYDKPAGSAVGSGNATLGSGFYVSSILYTGSLGTGNADDPAYEVVFLRDGDLSPVPSRRPDVIVDASAGALEVTSDLLRRIEVRHGSPAGDTRTYNELVKGWNLVYADEAPFGKSMLEKVEQFGDDGAVAGSHTFEYYDEVAFASGAYDGFADDATWNSGGNDLSQSLLSPVGLSALGASETNSGGGHAYLGFNLSNPSKTGSFGGSLAISGSGTGGLIEMLDLNGDMLPDKVFRKNITGAGVQYRLNNGDGTFGDARNVVGIGTLSTEANIGVSGGPEVYFGVTVQFNIAADVTIGEQYFTDVNNDGLPDYVSAGQVYFNTPTATGPEFRADSGDTPVPIDDGTVDLDNIEKLAEFEELQRANSPRQDVVRRWVAPYAGTVSITGTATLDDGHVGDGVRLAIQHGSDELWAANLLTAGASTTPPALTPTVQRGEAVYFRVGSVDDGANDRVEWAPVITYTSLGDLPTDANDLSQTAFVSADEFTLAGRPDTPVLMPLRGTVKVEGTLTKSAPTSDDLTLLVLRNGIAVASVPVAADLVGDIELNESFTVAAPTGDEDALVADKVVVRIAADSPIDPTVLSFAPRLYYTAAFDGDDPVVVLGDLDGDGLDDDHTLELNLPYDIDLYPTTDETAPRAPWTSTLNREVTVNASVVALVDAEPGQVTLTVKRRTASGLGEVLAKQTFDAGPLGGSTELTGVALESGDDYWFDLTVRDPDLSERITSNDVTLTWTDGGADDGLDVPETLNSAGRQGIFPIAHRGWAYAGYNADYEGDNRSTDPLSEQAFVFQQSDYPTSKPTGFNDSSYKDPAQGESYPYVAYLLRTPGSTEPVPVWRGLKDNLVGGADFASSSRTGSDSIGVTGAPGTGAGAGVRAVRRVGLSAPIFGLVAGIGPLTAAFGAGPSFGLLDYVDVNADGFPDVVAPGRITYTTPRGGFLPGSGSGPDVAGQDTTFAISGGFNGTAIDIKGNSKGDANTAQDTATTSGTSKKATTSGSAQQGEPADTQESGANVGGSLGVTAQFTNPGGGVNSDWGDSISQMDLDTSAPLERELADVNGDSLPDLVLAGGGGVRVRFNLGHSFSPTEVQWSQGGFENGESYSGSVGPLMGFNFNNKEFSGGLSFNEGIDQARYSWVDVDGDGVLDRVRKTDDGTRVAFASGSGARSEVDYGDMVEGKVDLIGSIPLGQQASQDRSRGLGGGFDFTIPIGPLCLAGCYIIVNPGASFDHSLSSSQVQLTDVDGDGNPDSVLSTEDGTMTVRANNRGRTNLLKSVTNPLGGTISLGYERDGNTPEQPLPLWLMTSVQVDDGRPGDGPAHATTFGYEGNRFDKVERELMGYRTIVEEQLDGPGGAVLRRTVSTYGNATVFDSGLLESQEMQAPDGTPISRTDSTWVATTLEAGAATIPAATPDPVITPTDGTLALALLDDSRGVVRTQVLQSWFDADGDLGTSLKNTFEYDALGNPVRQVDHGQAADPIDDLVSLTTYPDCRDTSWVATAATFTVLDHADTVLRYRDGSTDLCLNAVPIHIEERIDADTDAITDLTFDAWGSYNQVAYPENADGDRYVVDYVYDADRHTDVAEVTDSHGLTARASFSAAGLVTERVDANGNATRYTYDAFNRLATVRSPNEQDPGGPPTVAYEYAPTAAAYGYAIARHHDRFNPGDTIDTVAFVDGMARVTQTKRDYTMINDDPTLPAVDQVLVAGAIEYDALGREIKEWWPTIEPLGTFTTYQAATDPYPPTLTSYTLLDQVSKVELPYGEDNSDPIITTIDHGFGSTTGLPVDLFLTTVTDPIAYDSALAGGGTATAGKQQVTYTDVRGNLLVGDDIPATADPIRTRYRYDKLGQLTAVVDNAGNQTSHSYDGLGRRLSTNTPDGGRREMTYDPAGNVVTETTPNLAANGQSIAYRYDFDRLATIDYPASTPDVAYTYGASGAPGNGAGRVVGVEDGARSQTLTYDALGNVATEVTTMKAHNLSPDTLAKLTFTTGFSYDSLGRIDQLTYPDGEVLSHDYDSAGQLTAMLGVKECTQLGSLTVAITAEATTITVTEVSDSAPSLPFTIWLKDEQLRVTDRVATSTPGQYLYTVERGINGNLLFPTAVGHTARTKVISDEALTCSYEYLERQEYDQFVDRRLRDTGNGVSTQWGMDWIGRPETISTDTPVRNVQNLTYGYDKASNVVSMDNEVPPVTTSLFVGPSSQQYAYDPYYRLSSATGRADVAPDKVRKFALDITYDQHGNIATKKQGDSIGKASGKGKLLLPAETNYTFSMDYAGAGPHQLTKNGRRTYTYDRNGNLAKWVDAATKETRTMTWDAEDRITKFDDGSDTTTYTYDSDGRRALERGPDGETSFVNRWYTVRNGAVPWKHIWAGDDRMATKRSFDGDFEHQQYYLTKDLQGSTNVVTDDIGKVFEHWEYFPGGEPWIREDSTVHRTPYLYVGGYLDEVRDLLNLGARWYEPREGMFYSPDPMLYTDPSAVQGDPALLPAYTYAESSPLRLVDPGGLAPNVAGGSLSSTGLTATTPSATDAGVQTDTDRGSRLWFPLAKMAGSEQAKSLQAFSENYEMKPLIQVNMVKTSDGWKLQDVKVSAFIGITQKTVYKGAGDRNGADSTDDSTNVGLGGQTGPQPGAGTPALDTGPAAFGAGGAADDAGEGSLGDGVSATGPSGLAGGTASRADSLSDGGGMSRGSTSASLGGADAGSVDGAADSSGA
ncbi:SpvB/TcaC N-terminal domain-containing protein [Tessaracoccus sp. Z1128]